MRTPDTYGWLTKKIKQNKKIKKIDTGAYMSLTKQTRKIQKTKRSAPRAFNPPDLSDQKYLKDKKIGTWGL